MPMGLTMPIPVTATRRFPARDTVTSAIREFERLGSGRARETA
jgi:hypothetical protein